MSFLVRRGTVIVLCSAALSCASLSGQSSTDAPAGRANLWFHRVAVTRDIIPYGDDPAQVLDVYQQGSWVGEPTFFDRSPEPLPTLVFIHGGGWVVRDRRPEPLFFTFLEHGWHVVSITYRLGPETAPAAVDDAICALDWIVSNAADYGFDPETIVVAGVSAGGHLALTTGTLGSRPGHQCFPGDGFRVHSVINWLGITDIEAVSAFLDATDPEFGNYALAWIGEESRVAEISQRYSPLKLIDSDSPPVLTIHGTEDSVVPYEQATALHQRLDELGIRNELLSLPEATHAGISDEQFRQAFSAMLGFVDED